MQFSHWETSLEVINQIRCSFFWSHKPNISPVSQTWHGCVFSIFTGRDRLNWPSRPWCRTGQRSRRWQWRRRPRTISPSDAWHSWAQWRTEAGTAATWPSTLACHTPQLEGKEEQRWLQRQRWLWTLTNRDYFFHLICTWNFERHHGAVPVIFSLSLLVVLVVLIILIFVLCLVPRLQSLKSAPPVQTLLSPAHSIF